MSNKVEKSLQEELNGIYGEINQNGVAIASQLQSLNATGGRTSDWQKPTITNSTHSSTTGSSQMMTRLEAVNRLAMQLETEESFSDSPAKLLPKIQTILYNDRGQDKLGFSKIALPKNGRFYSSWEPREEKRESTVQLGSSPGESEFISQLKHSPEIERLPMLIAHIQQCVATVLGVDIDRAPEPDVSFFNMGMDSLMVVDLQKRLEKSLNVSLSSTLAFNYPTVEMAAKYLLETELFSLVDRQKSKLPEVQSDNYLQELAAKLEKLTDADVEALLLRKLQTI